MLGATTTTVLTNHNFYAIVLPRILIFQLLLLPTLSMMMITPLDDDNTTAPDPTFVQEWNKFNNEFNNFYDEFVHFYNKYAPSTTATLMNEANASLLDFSIYDDNDSSVRAQQCHVFTELDKVNHQLSQLLNMLKNPAPSPQPNCDTSNLQQLAQLPESQLVQISECVTTGLVPLAPNHAPTTRVPGTFPWLPQSTLTTIPNEIKMVVCDCILLQLPPPAPDLTECMEYDGASL